MKDFEQNDMQGAEEPSIVTLLDEEGNEHEFEHVDSFPFNGETYVVLLPTEEAVAEGEAEIGRASCRERV